MGRPDLASVVLRLEPQDEEADLNRAGRFAHAAFLYMVARESRSLARRLHDREGPKPFTLALARDHERPGGLFLRATSLDPELSEVVEGLARRQPWPVMSLGTAHFTATRADGSLYAALWEGAASWEELASPTGRQETRVALRFATPTAFSFGRRNVVLPQPELVFGSLLRRWNAFAPVPMPPELQVWFKEALAVSELRRVATRMLDFGRFQEKGFVGDVVFEALGRWTEAALRGLHALADFAFFGGVGHKTTMGMGQARRLETEVSQGDNGQA